MWVVPTNGFLSGKQALLDEAREWPQTPASADAEVEAAEDAYQEASEALAGIASDDNEMLNPPQQIQKLEEALLLLKDAEGHLEEARKSRQMAKDKSADLLLKIVEASSFDDAQMYYDDLRDHLDPID